MGGLLYFTGKFFYDMPKLFPEAFMALSGDEVKKIADLARLSIQESDVDRYASHLSAILDYVEKLNALDVSSIEPTAHAMMVATPFREDVVVCDETLGQSLKNAPQSEDTFFKVPKVIGS